MKKLNIIVAILLALGLSSCSDSFFDLTPNDQVTRPQVYKTENDFKLAVNACYSKLQTQMDFYVEMCEFRSDELTLNAPTAGTQDRYDIDQFKDVPSNGILDNLWANFNNGVYRCNLILASIDDANFNPVKKAQYKAEAMFIRSLTYFNMYRAWGCVPITYKPVTVEESLGIGRATEQEMYDMIAGQLEEIVDNEMLPKSYKGDDLGRATLGSAKALLGKVYLTFGKPEKAVDILKSLMTDNTHDLLPNIADVFDVNNKGNKEVLFAIRYNKAVEGEGHGAWYSFVNLSDDNYRTETLNNLYTSGDKRADMLEFVKVPGVELYTVKKFFDEIDPTYQKYGADNILLRYADVLLMYAEALNEVSFSNSQSSEQAKALNRVHERAGLTPIDVTEATDKAAFRKLIEIERQKEFAYEGQRWFDEVRLGGAKEAALAEGHEIQDYQFVYPIPSSELERINNTKLLWQNTGY